MSSKFNKVATVIFLALFTIFGISQASADPYSYLNNGFISFNDPVSNPSFLNNNSWGAANFYTTPYDKATAIALTNDDGWGVSVTHGDFCYTVDHHYYSAGCGAKGAGVTEETATIDYSGLKSFTESANTYTYGTIKTSHQVDLGGQRVLMTNSINLDRGSTFAVVTTTVKNLGASISDLNLLINNFDGMLYDDSGYRSTRGNVTGGAFTPLTSTGQSSNAVLADAQEYTHAGTNYGSILLAGPSSGSTTSNLNTGCCSPDTVAYVPNSSLSQSLEDGSYAVIKSLTALGTDQSFTFKWVFGGADYTTLTSSANLTALLAAVRSGPTDEEIAAEAARVAAEAARVAAEAARVASVKAAQLAVDAAYALKMAPKTDFGQWYLGSDKVADPTGEIRGMLDEIMRKYGNLIK